MGRGSHSHIDITWNGQTHSVSKLDSLKDAMELHFRCRLIRRCRANRYFLMMAEARYAGATANLHELHMGRMYCCKSSFT